MRRRLPAGRARNGRPGIGGLGLSTGVAVPVGVPGSGGCTQSIASGSGQERSRRINLNAKETGRDPAPA
jgi:hypothetical protein